MINVEILFNVALKNNLEIYKTKKDKFLNQLNIIHYFYFVLNFTTGVFRYFVPIRIDYQSNSQLYNWEVTFELLSISQVMRSWLVNKLVS